MDVFGAQAGDVQSFGIVGPDGSVFLDDESVLDESNVSWFAFGGRRRPAGGWAAGMYVGRYELARNGVTIISQRIEIEIGAE